MEAKMQSHFKSTCVIILMFAIIFTVFMVSCGEQEVELDSALQEIVNYKFGDTAVQTYVQIALGGSRNLNNISPCMLKRRQIQNRVPFGVFGGPRNLFGTSVIPLF